MSSSNDITAINDVEDFEPFAEKVSTGRLLVLSFQHVLTMMPASLVVPLILGSALNLDAKTTSRRREPNRRPRPKVCNSTVIPVVNSVAETR